MYNVIRGNNIILFLRTVKKNYSFVIIMQRF